MPVVVKIDSVSGGTESVAASTTETFFHEEITIGRLPTNDLVLPEPDVSGEHAILTVSEENGGQPKLSIKDLGSSNGTFIEDERIEANVDTPLGADNRIVISKFILTTSSIDPTSTQALRLNQLAADQEAAKFNTGQVEVIADRMTEEVPLQAAEIDNNLLYQQELKIKRVIHDQLLERLDLRRKDILQLSDDDLRRRARQTIENILVELRWQIPLGLDREKLIKEILDEALGLGPLEVLLADEDVSEIMVNSYEMIYAERKGKLGLSGLRFSSETAVLSAIERIIAPIGRRIDESSPIADARLKDGSRVNAVIRPLALQGPCITIRKFSKDPLTIADLVGFGSMSQGMAEFLQMAVENRLNVVISGGTGSGKTTLLNVVSSFVDPKQRVITIEDAAELQLPQEHIVKFETRPPNLEGKGAITIRDLVKNALRMRPDRIIVGECRGAETLDMLQAMNTGHDGSMTTGHANSPSDMLSRLETMVLMAGLDLPVRAIREQIASAVDLMVQQTRFSCGSRKVTAITEVVGMDRDEGTIITQDVFRFQQKGYDDDGKTAGFHQATGYIPEFFRKLQEEGKAVNADVFSPEKF